MYFHVNVNVFFKLIKVHLLVSELYIYQNARCNDKTILSDMMIYLSTAISLTPGGSGTVHIYTQTIQRTTQIQTIYRTTPITKGLHK